MYLDTGVNLKFEDEWNLEKITRTDSSVINCIVQCDDGNTIEIPIKKSSIDDMRYLLQSKSVHLVDVLHKVMVQYQKITSMILITFKAEKRGCPNFSGQPLLLLLIE